MTPVAHPNELEHLQRFIREHNIACPGCRASLQNLTAAQCPRCREHLALRFAPSRARLLRWLATLLPLAMASGIGLFFVFLVTIPTSRSFPSKLYPIFFELLAIPFLIALVVLRRSFTRLSFTAQSLCAVAAILLTILPLYFFFAVL